MAETEAEQAAAMPQADPKPVPTNEETVARKSVKGKRHSVGRKSGAKISQIEAEKSENDQSEGEEMDEADGEGSDFPQSEEPSDEEKERLRQMAEEHKRQKRERARQLLSKMKGMNPIVVDYEVGSEGVEGSEGAEGAEEADSAEMEEDEKEREGSDDSSEDSDIDDTDYNNWTERTDFLDQLSLESIESSVLSLSSISDHEDSRPSPDPSFLGGFLREFESLPSLSDISENSTVPSAPSSVEIRPSATASGKVERISLDPGRVVKSVSHMSGTPSAEPTPSESSSSSEDEESDEDEEEQGAEEQSQGASITSIVEEPDTVRKELVIQEGEDLFAQIYIESESEDDEDQIDPALVQQMLVTTMISDFLDNLLQRAVELAEIGARVKLFDKEKMLMEIENLAHQFIVEKSTNSTLNNKMGEHCKRNRKQVKYATLPPAIEAIESRRYQAALNQVDNLMERSRLIKINGSFVISRAQLELHSCYTLSKFTLENLEARMRKGILRQESDKMRRFLDAELRRMENLRNEISEKRYELNLNLRSLAVITEKMRLVERITDDLTTSEVQTATDNIIHLEKRLEDRVKDVLAMQANYKKFLIEKTCIREKRTMIAESLEIAKCELQEKSRNLYKLRHYLSNLQAKRYEIKNTHARQRAKGGLLFYPALMYEYDKCIEEVLGRRVSVAKLRKTFKDLSHRLSMLERQKTMQSLQSVS